MNVQKTYFIRFRGVVKGPFDLGTLQTLVARRQLTRAHSISTDGIAWRTASEFSEVFGSPERQSVRDRLEETVRLRRRIHGETEPDSPVSVASGPKSVASSAAAFRPETVSPDAGSDGAQHIFGLEGKDEIGTVLASVAIGAAAAVLLVLALPFGVHDGELQSIVAMAQSADPTDAMLLALVLASGGAALATAFARSLLTRGVTWIVAGSAAAVSLSSYPGLPIIGPLLLAQIWFWPAVVAGATIWRWCEPDARAPRVLLIIGGSVLAIWALTLLSITIGGGVLTDMMFAGGGGSSWLPIMMALGLLLWIGSPASIGTLAIVVGSTGGRRGPIRPTVIACGLSASLLAFFVVATLALTLASEAPQSLPGSTAPFAGEVAALDVLQAVLWTARFCGVLVAGGLLIGTGFAQLAIARAERRVLESGPTGVRPTLAGCFG